MYGPKAAKPRLCSKQQCNILKSAINIILHEGHSGTIGNNEDEAAHLVTPPSTLPSQAPLKSKCPLDARMVQMQWTGL